MTLKEAKYITFSRKFLVVIIHTKWIHENQKKNCNIFGFTIRTMPEVSRKCIITVNICLRTKALRYSESLKSFEPNVAYYTKIEKWLVVNFTSYIIAISGYLLDSYLNRVVRFQTNHNIFRSQTIIFDVSRHNLDGTAMQSLRPRVQAAEEHSTAVGKLKVSHPNRIISNQFVNGK